MIRSLKIKNFQSIEDATLELGAVTTVVGPSDVGKSAIVRAIRALALNKTDESLFHKGNGPLEIEITTDEGTVKLERQKGKSATYFVGTQHFTKTGREVPVEVQQRLGIKEYQVDKDVRVLPAIQSQFGQQFLVQFGDTVVSKTIGRISNINIVFSALRKAQAAIFALQQKHATTTAQLDSVDIELGLLADSQVRLDTTEQLTQVAVQLDKALQNLKTANALAVEIQQLDGECSALQEELGGSSALLEALKEAAPEDEIAAALHGEMVVTKRDLLKLDNFEEAASLLILKCDDALTTDRKRYFGAQLLQEMEETRAEHQGLTKIAKQSILDIAAADKQLQEDNVCPLISETFKPGCQDLIKLRAKA